MGKAKKNKQNKKESYVKKVSGGLQSSSHKKETFLKERDATGFSLDIDPIIYEKIMTWVDASQYEVSWFGTLKRVGNTFKVLDVHLLKQEVNQSETEIDDDALSELMFKLIKDNAEGDLNWWGHSHVNMDVFWSGQDMHTIRDIGRRGWVLASVFNQRREIRTAFLQSVEVMGNKHDIFVDDIPTYVVPEIPSDLRKAWVSEYNDKVDPDYSSWMSSNTPSNHVPKGYAEIGGVLVPLGCVGKDGHAPSSDKFYDRLYDNDPERVPGDDELNIIDAASAHNMSVTAADIVACFWDSDNFIEALRWLGLESDEVRFGDMLWGDTSFNYTLSLDKNAGVSEFVQAIQFDLGWTNPDPEGDEVS